MKHVLLSLFLSVGLSVFSQAVKPDLQNLSAWQSVNRSVVSINENGRKFVKLDAANGDGLLLSKNAEFTNGSIEFDVRGKNVAQQSFVGIAFHLQDEKTFVAIFFRPFNFMNLDTAPRCLSVHYISMHT